MSAEGIPDGSGEDDSQRREAGLQSAGARLQAARNERQLSVEAVAAELRLSVRVVEALEAGDHRHLPGHAFVRGYVRSYARMVGLPEQQLLDELGEARPAASAALGRAGSIRARPPLPVGKWLAWGLAALVVLLAVIYGVPVVDRLMSGGGERAAAGGGSELVIPLPDDDAGEQGGDGGRLLLPAQRADDIPPHRAQPPAAGESPAPEPATAAPVAEETPPVVEREPEPPAVAPARAELRLRLDADSWVEVSAGGRKLVAGILHAGSERTLRGQPPFEVLLGNAPAVEVEYNGKPFDTTSYRRGRVARFRLGD